MIAFKRTAIAPLALLVTTAIVGAQTPPETPDQPAPSAPIAPSIALPSADPIGRSAVEPPAAAQSGLTISPAQEAAEILASGRFLAPLIPEGGMLARAQGSLSRDEFLGVWTFELSDRVNGAANRSLIILPAESLADMIKLHQAKIKNGATAQLFEVSGFVLECRGVNYLLPSFSTPIERRTDRPGQLQLIAPGSNGATGSKSATSTVKPSTPTTNETNRQAVAQQLPSPSTPATRVDPETFAQDLERRLNERVAVIPSSSDPSEGATPAAPGVDQPSLVVTNAGTNAGTSTDSDAMPVIEATIESQASFQSQTATAGTMVMPAMRIQSRRGTVTRDPLTGTWRFIFASGVCDDGDVALELLPCAMLTQLIDGARSGFARATILLTGDITVFEGRNYLRPIRSQPLTAGKWIGP